MATTMRSKSIAVLVAAAGLGLIVAAPPARARGGHYGGFGMRSGTHGHHGFGGGVRGGGAFAGDQRHANDDYVKAASQEEERLLDTKIKSICRGC